MSAGLCWLLYDDGDLALNRGFAELLTAAAARRGVRAETIALSRLACGVADGRPALWLDGRRPDPLPDFAISRQRSYLLSRQLELMGVRVFNPSEACRLCNDKRRTLQLMAASGVPVLDTLFAPRADAGGLPEFYPAVVKPAASHGGDRVVLVRDRAERDRALAAIAPGDALVQRVADEPGKDVRVYALFGEPIAAVLRTAKDGIVSNFKRGGDVRRYELSADERALVARALAAFASAGAPLAFAGVDFLFDRGGWVLGETEDVVGCRMLYQTHNLDAADAYMAAVCRRVYAPQASR